MAEKLLLYAVGDIGIHRDGPGQDPKSALRHVAAKLKEADIGFCQLERSLSTRGAPLDAAGAHSRVSPNMATALTSAGFNVVSFASNHTNDWGPDALLDTIDVLKKNNMAVVGVGKNIDEARKPVIVEKKGTKIAFLAYCSVLKPGYEATANRPGVAPMRAYTLYQAQEWQAATPCEVLSFPAPDDLEAMEEDIKKVRPLADIVVISHHWGIHFQPAVVAMYQKRVGHACINAGADLIIGTHAHILKGTEVYKGKVITYSLCNFALDDSAEMILHSAAKNLRIYGWTPDPNYPGYGMPVDSRKTAILKVVIGNKKIEQVSLLPAYINKNAEPELLPRNDKRFDEVVDYMTNITMSQGLNSRYLVKGDEALITV